MTIAQQKIEFPKEEENIVRICEFFPSIQGEGTHTGAPSIFVRFSGCDMRCSWCDTRFSSWWANDFERMDYDKVVEGCIKMREETGCKHVIFTGGEPTIQPIGLVNLAHLLKEKDFYTTMESNGNNFVGGLSEVLHFASFSPKLTPGAGKAWTNVNALVKYYEVFGQHRMHLKWVISDLDKDLDYLMDHVYKLLEQKIGKNVYNITCYLQPDGYTESLNEYANRGAALAEKVCNEGPNKYVEFFKQFRTFRVTMQNHRVWWNNERRK
jgi:7-carboxy-7-deazaguanine synthase